MKEYFIRGNKLIMKEGKDIKNSVIIEGKLDDVINRCKLKGFNGIFVDEDENKDKKKVLSCGRRKVL